MASSRRSGLPHSSKNVRGIQRQQRGDFYLGEYIVCDSPRYRQQVLLNRGFSRKQQGPRMLLSKQDLRNSEEEYVSL
jgi:hypothetical protein